VLENVIVAEKSLDYAEKLENKVVATTEYDSSY
jgi:hypothetical protein